MVAMLEPIDFLQSQLTSLEFETESHTYGVRQNCHGVDVLAESFAFCLLLAYTLSCSLFHVYVW